MRAGGWDFSTPPDPRMSALSNSIQLKPLANSAPFAWFDRGSVGANCWEFWKCGGKRAYFSAYELPELSEARQAQRMVSTCLACSLIRT